MDVILYSNSAPNNKLDKTSNLSNPYTLEDVKFIERGALDILNPSVLARISTDIGDMIHYNYMYIPKLKRYYYINKISAENGLVRFDGKVDVLMSHKKSINKSKQYILRQQEQYVNPYLQDNLLPIRSDHNYIMKPFGEDVFNKSCGRLLLATTGTGGLPI